MNRRSKSQNNEIVSISIGAVDFHATSRPVPECGNIVATPRPPRARPGGYLPPLDRRATRRIASALAGLIAFATIAPAAGHAQPPRTTSAAKPSRAPEPAPAPEPRAEELAEARSLAGWSGERGTASWYGQRHHGRRTATGDRFNQHALTAAHPWLPLGTRVRVTRRDTGQSVIVTINDRLPSTRRVIDLSQGAARQLDMIRIGIADVDIDPG